MAPTIYNSLTALEENSADVYMESTEVLLKIARNILKEPSNPKFRSISLGSVIVTNKLLTACGAMECLLDMGFEEGDDKLILPQEANLSSIKLIHDELLQRRAQKMLKNAKKLIEIVKPVKVDKISIIRSDLLQLQDELNNSFLKKNLFWFSYIFKYENLKLQKKALGLIPIVELNLKVMHNIRNIQLDHKKNGTKMEDIDYQELLLIELCDWFKNEFFTWVDTPDCIKCGRETVHDGKSIEVFEGANKVEVYKCLRCNEETLFPRYNDPDKLLETRRGRCGEWANCFCLLCRSLGWDSRLIFDETDHVWVEVYSLVKSKWIHCDPCENAIDTPLMYEYGWKKKLSYVLAYSKDEIQDVTWRYSSKHAQVLKNRDKCDELDLVDFIIRVRNILLKQASQARKSFVIRRTAQELVELMRQKSASDVEGKSRLSGSLIWRTLRGEITLESEFKPYIWIANDEDIKRKKMIITYNTSKDEYYRGSDKVAIRNWRNGLFKMKSVFKKNETDWKMCYLARTEYADRGDLSWKFDVGDQFKIGIIELKLIRKTYETGVVNCKLCSDSFTLNLPNVEDVYKTNAFVGSKSVELAVELFGGEGSCSWQHAQILRQSFDSEENTMQITINLVEI